ncbi:uncharacterized protein LOC112683743 isoform X2 [Sipha flava]|uniref:Uncharacterized protein LOC112683743 isoform X2 n=1 Tax=Sipha flava TaxID=143950 RepID=A0A8B8FK19_9HEMI|nr:uncharacterized protein LOC112683743 isoform X2 [Sipha flava]
MASKKCGSPSRMDLVKESQGRMKDDEILKVPKNTVEVRGRLTRLLEIEIVKAHSDEEFLAEVPTKRKFNVKLQGRKQLDKQKMIRKKDRCFLCKRGILRGRLVNCHYCNRLYHLNCLDTPIRDWDHNMRWICPAHNNFFQLSYPELFTPGAGVISDTITMKRQRCELPRLPKYKFFNVPSHIDAMYKEPEENIPMMSTDNSSLNILCDVASLELESIDSDQHINYENRISNNISVKFLPTSQHLSILENNNNLLSKQPCASLTFLSSSTPITISIQEKSFKIGKSYNNHFSLQDLGNCEFLSDYHATITFDDELGDYLVKNHSRHGLIVDDVSYFGNRRPKESSNSELKKINSQVKKFINKQRRQVWNRNLIRIYQNNYSKEMFIRYIGKKRRFNFEPLLKYYTGKLKKNKHDYKKVECMCSKRFPPKDGYAGQALLCNGSIMSIGCFKFEFTYDIYTKEITKGSTENLETKQDGNKLNGVRLKPPSEQENCINITKCNSYEQELVTINSHCSLEDTDDTNSFNEQNNISLFDNSQDFSSSKERTIINGISKNVTMHENDFKPPLEVNLPNNTICTSNLNNTDDILLDKCFANDLIQEVDVLSDDGGIIEEEIVYEINVPEADISTTNSINDDQDWIIEEIVVEADKNDLESSVNLQLSSPLEYSVPENNRGDYKTEHMYCARSPSYNEPIVISDDDE